MQVTWIQTLAFDHFRWSLTLESTATYIKPQRPTMRHASSHKASLLAGELLGFVAVRPTTDFSSKIEPSFSKDGVLVWFNPTAWPKLTRPCG